MEESPPLSSGTEGRGGGGRSASQKSTTARSGGSAGGARSRSRSNSTDKLRRHPGEHERRKRETANLFSSLFFGWNPNNDINSIKPDGGTSSAEGDVSTSSSSSPSQGNEPIATKKTETQQQKNQRESMIHSIASQVDKLIPADPHELRKTSLYKNTYKLIQWQRDNYLVGSEYAEWRRRERLRGGGGETEPPPRDVSSYQGEIIFDADALGHKQVGRLAADFVPSDTVRKALLPIVVTLPMSALYGPSQAALVRLILGQQDTLDHLLKYQLMQFLGNPRNRAAIKNSTKGYISTTIYK